MADTPFTQIDKERLDVLAGVRRGQTDQRAVRWADLGKVNAATRGVHRLIEKAVRDLDDIERAITPGDPLDVPLGLSLSTALTPSGARLRADWIGTIVPNGATFYDLRIRESGGNDIIHPTASNRYEWQVQRGITYCVSVRTSDRFGNKSAWSADECLTSAKDDVPPDKVTGLSAAAGFGVIWLTWDASAADDLSHYEIFEQATATPAPDASTSATLSTLATGISRGGLGDDETRHYWVRAVDTSGNLGEWSNPTSETTLDGAGVDPVSLAAILNDVANAGIVPSQAIAALAAEKLAISSLDNLVLNNLLTTDDGWSLDADVTIDTAPANIERSFAFSLASDTSDQFAEYKLRDGSIRPGASYLVSMIARGGGSAPRQFTPRIEVDWLDRDGVQIGATEAISFAPSINTTPQTVAEEFTAPSGAISALVRFGRDTGSGDARVAWISAPRFSEMNAGQLIVDGAIQAKHLSTGELITETAQIKDAIITNAKIYDVAANKITVAALNAGITVGSTGVSIGTIQSQADDPAARINQKATVIEPGKVLISGATRLSDWAKGGDTTKIDGGMVSANTVRANALEIGNRALQLHGILFDYNEPGQDQVSWTAGEIHYVGDDGNPATANITAGYDEWTSGTLYLYWTKGATTISASSSPSVAYADGNAVLATYRGDDELSADYGKTIVDAGAVKTDAVITSRAQIAEAIITSAHVDEITSEKITVINLIELAESGALSSGKVSPTDPSDGIFFGQIMGGDGNPRFHLAASRLGVSGQNQVVAFTNERFSLTNAQHYITADVAVNTSVTTTTGKVSLPPGTTRFRVVNAVGGGGGGAGGRGAKSSYTYPNTPGGPTIIELYDGATLKNTFTAPGAPGGSNPYQSAGFTSPMSPYGDGGNGSTYTWGKDNKKRYQSGGYAGILIEAPWVDVSGWASPQVKITIGEGGPRGTQNDPHNNNSAGSPGKVVYQTSAGEDARADVVPIRPTAQGTFLKAANTAGSFPDLGPGFWLIRNVTSIAGMNLGSVDLGDGNPWIVYDQVECAFFASETPAYTGGPNAYTIAYRFHSMGAWGN